MVEPLFGVNHLDDDDEQHQRTTNKNNQPTLPSTRMIQLIQTITDRLVDSISSLLSLDRDGFYEQLYGGWELALWTLAVTAILEVYSFQDTVLDGVWKQPNGKHLYIQAIQLNVFNHIVLGIPVYMLAVLFCRREDDVDNVDSTGKEDEESTSPSSWYHHP